MDDLLHGGNEISEFLGLEPQRVWALARNGQLPVFHLGKKISARKSTLIKWMEKQEALAFPDFEQTPTPPTKE